MNEVNVQTQASKIPTSEGGHNWNSSICGAQNPLNNHIGGINMCDLISEIGSENNQSKNQGNGSSIGIDEVNTNVIINLPSFGGNNGQEDSYNEGESFSNIKDENGNGTSSSQLVKPTIVNYIPSLKWLFVFIDN
jgi:hypothetical protein